MRKMIQRCLVATAIIASMCGSAAAEDTGKDWYLALRLGYQPYQLDAKGTMLGRDFDKSVSLSDIMKKTDTTILGGEVEYGSGKWFTILSAFYQKSDLSKNGGALGADASFKEMGFNPMIGYKLYQTTLGDMPLMIDAMAGIFYVKIEPELTIYDPVLPGGSAATNKKIDFTDPMFGARSYLAVTKKFGVAASGEIGGFGAGSKLQTVVAGNLVYNFTDWLAMSGGYKYWYFKYEDTGSKLSRLEQSLYGPVVGLQFKY